MSDVSKSLRSLRGNEAIVSESLRSLTKNEQMSESLVFLSESLIRSFWTKNEQFARKSNERISSPGYDRLKTTVVESKTDIIIVYSMTRMHVSVSVYEKYAIHCLKGQCHENFACMRA